MCVNSKFKSIGCDSASCCFDELSAGQSGYLLGAIADLSGLQSELGLKRLACLEALHRRRA